MGFLFLLGVAYLVMRGWENGKSSRSQRRIAAAARPGVNHAKHKARARRQATAGWWGTEITRGFPVTREGFRDGWAEHRQHLAARQHAARQRDHQHRAQRASWLEEARQHWQELTRELEQKRERQPASPPLADGKTPGAPGPEDREAPVPSPGCTNPGCDCHKGSKSAAPAGSGSNGNQPGGNPVTTPSSNGSGGGGEPTFHSVNEMCDQAVQEAEQVAGPNLEACAQLADSLGAVIRDDSDMMGKAAELASAAAAFETSRKRILDAAQAVKDHNAQHYAPHQDATDSTGVTPERAYTANG